MYLRYLLTAWLAPKESNYLTCRQIVCFDFEKQNSHESEVLNGQPVEYFFF
jgi:hypothetical protein